MTLLAAALCGAAAPQVRVSASRGLPRPESQKADVVIRGETSWLTGALDVARVRDADPAGLSCGDFVRGSDGFAWFCSRHYALKTDLAESDAARILELLELAWPQYATIFGAAPPSERRMALVAASGRAALKRAMIDDSMFAFTLGGVTQEGYACSYLYAGTPYQTRYIVLHEATHLFQYCLSGNTRGSYGFFLEGVADFLSSHVYDPERHVLSVNVLDRAPIHNHLADGLEQWRAAGEPGFSALYGNPDPPRGIAVLLTAYLQSAPEYAARWREYCRRIVVRKGFGPDGARAASDALLDELYGGVAALDAPFAAWMRSLSPSFSLVRREFDQEGPSSFASCFPASAESPAVLEWRGRGVEPHGNVSVRWRDPVEKGSFAKVEFLSPDGVAASHTVSNAPIGSVSFVEVNGERDRARSGRRLHAQLRQGAAIDLGPAPECAGWRITASQPGVVFDMNGACAMIDAGEPPAGKMRQPAFATRGPEIAKPAETLRWRVLGPFALPGGAFGRCRRDPPAYPIDFTAVHTLDDGTFAVWREAAHNFNGAVSAVPIANLTASFGRQCNNCYAYAFAEVESEADRDATITLGVSDGVEIFVNGGKVLDFVHEREWQDGNVSAPVKLHRGRNEILLRLTHGKGVWLLGGMVGE